MAPLVGGDSRLANRGFPRKRDNIDGVKGSETYLAPSAHMESAAKTRPRMRNADPAAALRVIGTRSKSLAVGTNGPVMLLTRGAR